MTENLALRDCKYYDEQTIGCHMYGSCQCQKCPNYIKKTNDLRRYFKKTEKRYGRKES
ncbi:MAG: hypothetical protein HeimC3_13620 [Candidatus Heimdallarchaeota archaeon LC_3]|nr:MAG: hypothetical protein HeimC3_13620 [Candidatus Heimdallarchaeota archaeon LC_3]